MWLHPFVCMCVRFYVVWFEAQHISHMFTISSDSFLPICAFCLFFSLPMKMAPCILQSPPTWSNSLYYYNGGSVANRRDSKTAQVYFRRVMLANRDMSVLKTKWQQKLASDRHRDPTPIVLKSKWQAKWDELQDTLTPHQIVDMHLARRIWKLNVWTWEKERIAAGSCLRESL